MYYIFRKQLEEADAIVINKSDLVSGAELSRVESLLKRQFPTIPVISISARTGQGFDSWRAIVQDGSPAGERSIDVNYDLYAEGEAVLGWLNARVALEGTSGSDWNSLSANLLRQMQEALAAGGCEAAHIKTLLETSDACISANLTRVDEMPSVSGEVRGQPHDASLLVNARAQVNPETLRAIFEASLRAGAGTGYSHRILDIACFKPARPVPTHRDVSASPPSA